MRTKIPCRALARATLGAALTLLLAGCGGGSPSHRAPGSQPPASPASTASVPLAGQWLFHGQSLTISAGGAGRVVYRIYRWCGPNVAPPCDTLRGNEILSGGLINLRLTEQTGPRAARGVVITSTDPRSPPGTAVTMRPLPPDRVELLLGPASWIFCGPQSLREGACGA